MEARPTTHNVTNEQLADFGFAVEVSDKIMGTKIVLRPGMKRAKAVHAAWAAGLVRQSSPHAPRGTWAAEHGRSRPTPCPEMLAWATAKA